MSQFPLAKAAKLVGISRATMYRLVSDGKLTVSETSRGVRVVDAAELLRVFPKARLETGDSRETVSKRQTETAERQPSESELRAVRELLDQTKQSLEVERAEKARLLGIVESQTRLLEDKRTPRLSPDVLPNSTAFAVGFLLAGGVALLLFLLR